jgi:hypothetical protein
MNCRKKQDERNMSGNQGYSQPRTDFQSEIETSLRILARIASLARKSENLVHNERVSNWTACHTHGNDPFSEKRNGRSRTAASFATMARESGVYRQDKSVAEQVIRQKCAFCRETRESRRKTGFQSSLSQRSQGMPTSVCARLNQANI